MKRLNIIFLALFSVLITSAAPSDLLFQGRGPVNILEGLNPGFENGKQKWTATGGTFAVTTTAANVAFGTTSASWDASANAQTLTSAQGTIPGGLKDGKLCVASFIYKGGDANITAQVIDGTAAVITSKVLAAQTVWYTVDMPFMCPSSGTLALRLSAGADAAIMYLDNASIGVRDQPMGYGDKSAMPAGTIIPYGGSVATPPVGWLVCDGAAYNQADYPELYTAIGATWNNGTNPLTGVAYTTSSGQFRVPDLRSAFLRGVGGPNVATVTTSLGGYQADAFKKHVHTMSLAHDSTPIAGTAPPEYGWGINQAESYQDNVFTDRATGGVGGLETRPQNQGVNFIIKAWNPAGVYLGSGADNTAQDPLNTTPMTFTSNISNMNASEVHCGRQLDRLFCTGQFGFNGNGGAAATAAWTLPAGYTIDTAKLGTTATYVSNVGSASWFDSSAGKVWPGAVTVGSSTTLRVVVNDSELSRSFVDNGDRIGVTFSVPIVGWSGQDYIGKMMVGFASAGVGRSGLVNNDSSNTGGTPIKGRTDGTAPAAGYVGHKIDGTLLSTTLTASATTYNVGSIVLPAGNWMVYGKAYVSGAGSTHTMTEMSLSTTSATHNAKTQVRDLSQGNSGGRFMAPSPLYITTTGTTVYLTASAAFTGTSPDSNDTLGQLYAIRQP